MQTQTRYKVTTNHNGKNGHGKTPVAPDKLQPHNIEAEEAVIGSLLIDKDAILQVTNFLLPDDFYVERNSWIYETMLYLYEKRQPHNDLVTLTDELERRGQLIEAGGSARLTGFINATPTSINIEHYARIVSRTGKLRRLIGAASQIARLAYQDDADADGIIDQAQEIILGVSVQRETRTRPIVDAADKFLDRVEHLRQHQNELVGLPTGLKDLDKLLGGLQRSDLIILAGRPSMGKTSLALSIALQAARKWDKRIAIFSLEMSDEQIVERLVSAEAGIDSQRVRLGQIRDEEWPEFIKATNAIAGTPIFINDTPAISVLELRTEARKLKAEHGLDLLIVDYLQLMRGDSGSENRQQEISYISRSLKALARELKIPILALSQLSRQVESRNDKRPLLSDLRESGSLEQDADVALFMYREEEYNPDTEFPNLAEIICRKHRTGPTGTFEVFFKKDLAQFVDLVVRTQPLDYYEPAAYKE